MKKAIIIVIVVGLILLKIFILFNKFQNGAYTVTTPNASTSASTSLTIMVPQGESAYTTAVNEYISTGKGADPVKTWQFVKKEVAVPYTTDIIKASANAAAGEFSTGGGPAKATVSYLKIVNGTAYVVLNIDIDGWAGVSFSIAKIHPLVEKTLLQFPQIKTVVFGFAPGDSVKNVNTQ